jgi:hypothetical protein
MYDTKCYDLAKDFLDDSDKQPYTEQQLADLAQTIQTAIEDWLSGYEAPLVDRCDEDI